MKISFLLALGMAIIYRVDEKRSRSMLYVAWVLAMFLLAWLFDGRGIA